jgi:chromosome segregation ATPase
LLASRQKTPAPAPRETVSVASSKPAPVQGPIPADHPIPEQADNTLGPKVFRITEDQLDKVREVATWAKDVETRLGEEHQRVVELEEQNSMFRKTTSTAEARIGALEAALTETEDRLVVLQEQIRKAAQAAAGEIEALRETAASSAARVGEMEGKFADEQKRSALLEQRISETEHAASCAQKLADIFAEIGRLGPKS